MHLYAFRSTGNLPGSHFRNLPSAGHAFGPRKRVVRSADASLLCAAASCRSHALRFVSVALLILGVSVAGWSQASFKAQLRGNISDASGAQIPNATVTLTDEATGTALISKTDSEGRYTFLNLEPASYMLEAEAQGFGGQKRGHLVLRVAQESVLDLKLAVAGVATNVQVTDAPVLLNDSDAELGTEVTSRYINEVPLFDRQIEKLAYLSPGVVTSQGYATDQTNENFSSSGQRNSSAEIRLDGALTSTPEAGEGAMNWAHFQPSIEIIQEFKMQTSGSSAEYGSNGGTVMNMITKSGSNKLHGSAYWFGRNSATDANNWYAGGAAARAVQEEHRGRLHRRSTSSRTASSTSGHYENTQFSAPSTVRTTVPTRCRKERRLFQHPRLGTDANGNPVPITIYDPYNGRTEYPGSKIPSSEITALAKKVMALYPEPTDSGDAFHQNNFTKNYANAQPAHQYNARADWTITKTNQLSTRYSKGYLERQSPPDFEGAIGQGDERNDYNNAVSEYTHTFSNTVFLSARAGLDRHHQLRDAANTTDLIAMGFSPLIINMRRLRHLPADRRHQRRAGPRPPAIPRRLKPKPEPTLMPRSHGSRARTASNSAASGASSTTTSSSPRPPAASSATAPSHTRSLRVLEQPLGRHRRPCRLPDRFQLRQWHLLFTRRLRKKSSEIAFFSPRRLEKVSAPAHHQPRPPLGRELPLQLALQPDAVCKLHGRFRRKFGSELR